MKKITLLFMLFLMSTSIANATTNSNWGFSDPNMKKSSINEALKMKDDSFVVIQGNIVKRITNDKYMFKDSTGTITVEIDDEKWTGISANTKDKLELAGEIERKFNTVELDVDTIRKINK